MIIRLIFAHFFSPVLISIFLRYSWLFENLKVFDINKNICINTIVFISDLIYLIFENKIDFKRVTDYADSTHKCKAMQNV